ncbi:hypothetical protein JCM24511_06418 [Saitozyma sp. JCM 24511]|nr:hypothetical protein JCM24511_06418 [Saitozyma sp. JCM 24511]
MDTRLTLPPHLLETIKQLLIADVELPSDLRRDLEAALSSAAVVAVDAQRTVPDTERGQERPEDSSGGHYPEGAEVSEAAEEVVPPTIDVEVLEQLSRWATSNDGRALLKRKRLDPSNYLLISLLAGTEVYLPPSQRDRLIASQNPEKPNPYLPSYLSPATPSFGREFRSLSKQLTTIFNVLFSVFGSAFAVYFAATTGAGWDREHAILLGVLAGCVVGVADGVLVWIFAGRLEKSRKEARERGAELAKGSAKDGLKVVEREEGRDDIPGAGEGSTAAETSLEKRKLRLRRRGIGEADL